MKKIPIDHAGRVILPKSIRAKLNLHAGDQFEADVSAGSVILRPIRSSPARLVRHSGRLIWDATGCKPHESDFTDAIDSAREDRDQRAKFSLSI
jgi:AbrB family looped-hinge helix DNA binding protein